MIKIDTAALSRAERNEDKRFSILVELADLDPATDLRHVNLTGIVVEDDEDLSGYDFTGARLDYSDFRGVDLTGVVLTGASLFEADLRGAKITAGQLDEVQRHEARTGSQPPYRTRRIPRDLESEIARILEEVGTDKQALWSRYRETFDKGDYRLAEAICHVLADWEERDGGQEAPKRLSALHNAAYSRHRQGRPAEAEAALNELLPLREKVSGAEHPDTLTTRSNIAQAQLDQGKAAEAEAALSKLLPLEEKVKGPEHTGTLTSRYTLARAQLNQGKAAKAEAALTELLPLYEKVNGAEHPNALTTRHELARAQLDQGKAAKAEAALTELLPLYEKVIGAEHPNALTTRRLLSRANLELGNASNARSMMASLPEDGGDANLLRIGQTHLVRAFLADLEGRAEDAAAHLEQAAQALAHLLPEHTARRELECYHRTRVPGGAGGTTLWMLQDGFVPPG